MMEIFVFFAGALTWEFIGPLIKRYFLPPWEWRSKKSKVPKR